jgi:hypothetical protein
MDKDMIKSSFFIKYGFENPSQVEEFSEKAKISTREKNEELKYWIPLSQKTDWEIYKNKVRNLTRLSIKDIEWDGTDFVIIAETIKIAPKIVINFFILFCVVATFV